MTLADATSVDHDRGQADAAARSQEPVAFGRSDAAEASKSVAQRRALRMESSRVAGDILTHPSTKLREVALNLQHSAAAADVAALAARLTKTANLDESRALHLRSLAALERLEGALHQALAVNYNNFAVVYHQQGLFDQANAAYLRSLAMKRQILGERHPDVAMTMYNLGTLHVEWGQLAVARSWYEQALNLFRMHFGLDHPRCKRCEQQLAQLAE